MSVDGEKRLCFEWLVFHNRIELGKACLALFFVALIKVYSGNCGSELRNKPQPVSLVHLRNGVLRNSQGKR